MQNFLKMNGSLFKINFSVKFLKKNKNFKALQ